MVMFMTPSQFQSHFVVGSVCRDRKCAATRPPHIPGINQHDALYKTGTVKEELT